MKGVPNGPLVRYTEPFDFMLIKFFPAASVYLKTNTFVLRKIESDLVNLF